MQDEVLGRSAWRQPDLSWSPASVGETNFATGMMRLRGNRAAPVTSTSTVAPQTPAMCDEGGTPCGLKGSQSTVTLKLVLKRPAASKLRDREVSPRILHKTCN